jgi:hypothetical protein
MMAICTALPCRWEDFSTTAVNNGNGTVTFTITNIAGLNSFGLHVLPNRTAASGPMTNVTQTFAWRS